MGASRMIPLPPSEWHVIDAPPRLLPERPYRLWVTTGIELTYLDCTGFVKRLPEQPTWAEWQQTRLSLDSYLVFPKGHKVQFDTFKFRNAGIKLLVQRGSPDVSKEFYRPLYDPEIRPVEEAVTHLYGLDAHQIAVLQRTYACPGDDLVLRLLDFASAWCDARLMQYLLAYPRPDRFWSVALSATFRDYLAQPPTGLCNQGHATNLAVLQAGDLAALEREFLGRRPIFSATDNKQRWAFRETRYQRDIESGAF